MKLSGDVLTFSAGGSLYAVPVARVQEILDLRPVSVMPNAPAHLLGIADLRGANIPVVDLRILLGLPRAEDTPQTRIIVAHVEHGGQSAVVGIRTDRVIEVTQLDEGEHRPIDEASILGWAEQAISIVGRRRGELVSVLDLDRLFDAVAMGAHVGAPSATSLNAA